MRLLAPFIPFATEEIYQTFFKTSKCAKSIHLCGWPEVDEKLLDKEKIKTGKFFWKLSAAMRKYKAKRGLSMKAEIKKVEISCDAKTKKIIEEMENDLKAVGNIKILKFDSKKFSVKIA